MAINTQNYQSILTELNGKAVLIAVSKTKPIEDIQALYDLGHRDFGENYVQELVGKYEQLPKDIRWHFIGHLQSNKVKYIAPFIHLIHVVDSEGLLKEISKQAIKNNRSIDCLLQVYIAKEETKFGLDESELVPIAIGSNEQWARNKYANVQVRGLMGMASFSDDMDLVRREFQHLKTLFEKIASSFNIQHLTFNILSMGMSADYKIALEEGSTMVRIGNLLFGER